MNISNLIYSILHGVVEAKANYEKAKHMDKHFELRLTYGSASMCVNAFDFENLDKNPPEPISVSGVPDLIDAFPYPLLTDMLYTALQDSDKVAVSEPLLRTLVEIASKYDDFNERTFGALDSIKKVLDNHAHYSKVLIEKRKNGSHY